VRRSPPPPEQQRQPHAGRRAQVRRLAATWDRNAHGQ
jgi:hypothetical protein